MSNTNQTVENGTAGFGTMPVFMATISTILGAILFLRFGYAIAHVGFWGVVGIIILGHVVTFATAMAVAEIATNQKVEGGGAYFMISRSFGLNIGAAIGIALFLAQAISVAFYVIAFAEAFHPVLAWLSEYYSYDFSDARFISIPAMVLLTILILTKGADLGVKTLYIVVAVLFVSILLFFVGSTDYVPPEGRLYMTIENPDTFFYVFTIIFPAFTGIAAGLGLSGDLKEPKKALPLGTLSATAFGMIVYFFIAYKLTMCADPYDLANDQLYMSQIAAWGPAIPLGLACATISSAIGSIMIAPRTLQALGKDQVFPFDNMNNYFAKVRGKNSEPFNGAVITCIIAFIFIGAGNVNFVAEIISMFFMVTYGAICLVSFLEHFAGDPSYRPKFKSRWYISLIGAICCFWLMFQMNLVYAIVSIALMVFIYIFITYFKSDQEGLASIFQGVIFQISRKLQVFLQKKDTEEYAKWRPAMVCISEDTFQRTGAFDLLNWIANKYGFGTYLHYIPGYLSKEKNAEAKKAVGQLIKRVQITNSNIFLDTIISPSFTTAIAQVIQLPGISGKDNNMLLFEFAKSDTTAVDKVLDNLALINAMEFDVCILGSSERGFGYRSEIHIWITPTDIQNANLMIILGFILQGHRDWHKSTIKIMAMAQKDQLLDQKKELLDKIDEGRLPISKKNLEFIATEKGREFEDLVNEKSVNADITIVGFNDETVVERGSSLFYQFDNLSNVLFVNSNHTIDLY